MLSKSADYALRAAHHLADEHGAREPVTAGHLAEVLELPENFLSKLLYRLQQEGVLESRRGPGGGFRLARRPGEITLAAVVRPFDDVMEERQCLLGRPECRDDAPCVAHEEWKAAVGKLQRFFRETRLADLAGAEAPAGGTAHASSEDGPPPGETWVTEVRDG